MLVAGACMAQSHLVPITDYSEYEGRLGDYYSTVYKYLQEAAPEKAVVSMYVLPSLSPEYLVSVDYRDSLRAMLTLNRYRRNYWHTKDSTIDTVSVPISHQLANQIIGLVQTHCRNTKVPESERLGMDGTTYVFSAMIEDGTYCMGQVWSPEHKSLMHGLIAIPEVANDRLSKAKFKEKQLQKLVDLAMTGLQKL